MRLVCARDEKKEMQPFFIDENQYKFVDIVSSKTNMLINYSLLNGAVV